MSLIIAASIIFILAIAGVVALFFSSRARWFVKEILAPKGALSAPQACGTYLVIFGSILAVFVPFFAVYKDLIVPVFSAGGTLLVGGSFEVYINKKWGDKT